MKEKIERWFLRNVFPDILKENIILNFRIDELNNQLKFRKNDIKELLEKIDKIEKEKPKNPSESMENIMRASLGLPYINFHNIETDEQGNDNPPHYLKGLDSEARKVYITELTNIYKNPKFMEVMNYHINVLGNYSMQKASDNEMRNGRIGIIAMRAFRKSFEDANNEYLELNQEPEDFDKFGVLPG